MPGTIVLEAHRATSTLYLHVLDTVNETDLVEAEQSALAAESRVVRAFGSDAEIEALETGGPWPDLTEARP